MSLPHSQITPIPNNEPDATPTLWNVRYQEIDSNFQNLDERTVAVEQSIDDARGSYPSLPDAVNSMEQRLIDVEASGVGVDANAIARIKRATTLDWQYRYDRINFEFFAPDYTLIDRAAVAVIGGIRGDDSLDVADTLGMVADGYYVLSDAGNTRLIRVKAVLSPQRLRLYDTLDRAWSNAAQVALTNVTVVTANHAEAGAGSIWLSKLINVGNRVGRAVIRRSDNAAGAIRLFYRSELEGTWRETVGTARTTETDAVPVGFVDYEYPLPVADNIYLRADIVGETVTIQHIVAFGLQYLDIINSRIDGLEHDQGVLHDEWARHYLASRLDWLYRVERINYELFAPEYSLINRAPIGLREAAVVDDDTLDVGDNSYFEIGDYYLLTDSSHGTTTTAADNTRLVKVRAIHSDNIITITERLTRRFNIGSTVCKANLNVIGPHQAMGHDGEQWISKPILISQQAAGGNVWIRRTDNTAAIKLFWLDLTVTNPVWVESTGTLSQRGLPDNRDGVPAGFADYRYPVPAPGMCKIRIVVDDPPQWVDGVLKPNTRPITIQHIVTVGLTEHETALSLIDAKADKTSVYTKLETDAELATKADTADLINFYTKSQTYSKSEVDAKALGGGGSVDLSGYYTKAESDTALALKVNAVSVYTKAETYSKAEVDAKVVAINLYQGTWDATTPLPAATSANKGHFYWITVAGNGYVKGDWAISNGTSWDVNHITITEINGGTY